VKLSHHIDSPRLLESGREPPVALSVILPCYRAAGLALESAERLASALVRQVNRWEIIIVDDGGRDFPENWTDRDRNVGGCVRLIRLPVNRGKGAAVAAGMRAARGAVRIYTDIDLPYGTSSILLVDSLIRSRHFHMVIGDRNFPQSRYVADLPIMRRLASRVFSHLTATLVTGGFFDTQCGLKGFRGDVAEALFRLQRVERFAFDVELIYLALTYGLEIKRIPVTLETNLTSSVKVVRDALQTCKDLMHLQLNRYRGLYDSAVLRDLVAIECASATRELNSSSDLRSRVLP
jgi:dolichyl-phosphate beta-glucosyltransferase